MKEHFCPIEKDWIGFEGTCNWCGEKELLAKRTWVGLTDEEIDELFEYGLAFERPRVIYREIEAKLKEKNT